MLGLKPTVPFPQYQTFPFSLSHWSRVPGQKGEALEGWIHRAGIFNAVSTQALGYRRAGKRPSNDNGA